MPRSGARKRTLTRSRTLRLVLVVAVFCAGVAYGFLADRQRLFPFRLMRSLYFTAVEGDLLERQSGRWNPARVDDGGAALTEAEREDLSRLATLGYLRGTKPAGGRSGVTIHDPDLAYDGLTLLSSAHAHEAWLMDMNGKVLHSWARDFRSVWPDRDEARGNVSAEYWGYVYLFGNGDLLAVYDNFGLVKLDRDSNVLWSCDRRCHHDLFVTEDGTIYALVLEERPVQWEGKDWSIADNLVVLLAPNGEVQRRVSIFDALARSEYAPILWRAVGGWDVFHANTLELLDGSQEGMLPALRQGNVLLSLRELDTIAVLDLDAESIAWALSGKWRRQHNPTFLDSGRILLFNNIAGDHVSEVMEFDPLTQEVSWSYQGSGAAPFFTMEEGRNQRLPNGNTLITESDNGRIFEVTPDKEIVWEFVNPKRAGEENELIASIPMAVRLPRDFPLEWLEKGD